MFNLFRKLSTGAPASNPAEPVYPPQLHQFSSAEEWLSAWVNFRLRELLDAPDGRIYEINGQRMLPLLGSIGQDSAIAADGAFWIWLEDYDGAEDKSSWRVATPCERTWLIVCAQRRRFPELSALLPLRPTDAIACATCSGSGFIYRNTVICSNCCALGWLSP